MARTSWESRTQAGQKSLAEEARWFARLRRRLARRVPGLLEGHRVEVLVDGGPFFTRTEVLIRGAQRTILVETYILRSDNTGWRIAGLLAEAAQRGVEVALTYDAFGSLGLDEALIEHLEASGALTHAFAPLGGPRAAWPWVRRNHRKMLVVDGLVGIVGGMNLADDYASVEDGGNNWRDTAAEVWGPAVHQLEEQFLRTWRRSGRRALRTVPSPISPPAGEEPVAFLSNQGLRPQAAINRAYRDAFREARRSIRLTNAYFSPDAATLRALLRAARRGVVVELIVAGATDVWVSLMITRGLYGRLLRAGVQIYEWHERILHAKTAVIDGQWVTIGSANLNRRSFLHDIEGNVIVVSAEIGRQMEARFAEDRTRSTPIARRDWLARPWWRRWIEALASLVRPWF